MPSETLPELARAAVVLAVALVVGMFTALGIQGELLTRAARNDPIHITIAFGVVILGLVIPLIPGVNNVVIDAICIVLVAGGAIYALALGGISLAERETPILSMTPTWSDADTSAVSVKVTASATSLRSHEDIVLRVAALTPGSEKALRDQCRTKAGPWEDPTLAGTGKVLAWGTSGPGTGGDAVVTVTVRAHSKATDYVCAYAELRDRSPNRLDDDRFSWTVYRLTDVAAPTPQPVSTP
jgi:hypothetical protein